MLKAVLFTVAVIVGSVLTVLALSVLDFVLRTPFAVDELGMSQEYISLILGGVGTMCVVVMGWAAYVWIKTPRTQVPMPIEVKPADTTVPSRRICRPLTWLFRG